MDDFTIMDICYMSLKDAPHGPCIMLYSHETPMIITGGYQSHKQVRKLYQNWYHWCRKRFGRRLKRAFEDGFETIIIHVVSISSKF